MYGTMIIVLTVIVQATFIGLASAMLTRLGAWFTKPPFNVKLFIVLVCLVLWLVAGLSISAWIWAGAFLLLDVFQSLEAALYFSVVTFTTLGYGDVTLDTQWRLFGSLSSVNGLIIVGLNTAFLIEAINRISSAQVAMKNR